MLHLTRNQFLKQVAFPVTAGMLLCLLRPGTGFKVLGRVKDEEEPVDVKTDYAIR